LKYTISFNIPESHLKKKWPSFFMLGSCFAESQGKRLANLGFSVFQNPFGIVYNPVSIAGLLYRIQEERAYTKTDFIHYKEKYFCLEHHGSHTYNNLYDAVLRSNHLLKDSKTALEKADVVVLTSGTALVYHHLETKKIVANCHSIPNSAFEQLQLKFNVVKNTLTNAIKTIRQLNPSAAIICTVSPVRHLRSGVTESSRSKAALLAALHEVLEQEQQASYFPSFEIFMDELRDYRFAKEDMMHPTKQAEEYIFHRFSKTYFSAQSQHIIGEVQKFRKFEAHRSLNNEVAHQQLVQKKLKKLKEQYPFLHIDEQ
jgi:hypothetical protein